MEKRIVPSFESEAEEAKWWFNNREEFDKNFAESIAEGRLKRRTEPRAGSLSTTTIRKEG